MTNGRQRSFDKQKTLEIAMNLFWKKGYIGASLSELTSKMGINKPSLYAAFGNKEALFVSAIEHYLKTESAEHTKHLNAESVLLEDRVRHYLLSVISMLCDTQKPGGCFVAVSAIEAAGDSLPSKAHQAIEDANHFTESYLLEFFNTEVEKGNLDAKQNTQHLTLYVLTTILGAAALARNGKSQETLKPMIELVVSTFSRQ